MLRQCIMAADILKGESPSALSRKIPNYNNKEKNNNSKQQQQKNKEHKEKGFIIEIINYYVNFIVCFVVSFFGCSS